MRINQVQMETIKAQALKCHRCNVYNPDIYYVVEMKALVCFPCFLANHPEEVRRLRNYLYMPEEDCGGYLWSEKVK